MQMPVAHLRRGALDGDLHQAMLIHEAATIVRLVQVVLDLAANNYTRWRDQILLVIAKSSSGNTGVQLFRSTPRGLHHLHRRGGNCDDPRRLACARGPVPQESGDSRPSPRR